LLIRYFTYDGRIAYFAGAVVVLMDPVTKNQEFMGAGDKKVTQGHNDDITALAISPDRKKVATGQIGSNPLVIIWDIASKKIDSKLTIGKGKR